MAAKYSLQKLLRSYEDHLTAMVALALELDGEFRNRTAELLLARLPRTDDRPPGIARIEVQRDFGGPCPDLTLTLDDGRIVLVENKLEAPETMGPASPPMDVSGGSGESTAPPPKKQPQLKRYLHLAEHDESICGVAFIRASRKPVDPSVLASPIYLRPVGDAHHFLWRDFYPLISECTHPVTTWLRGAFEACGFTPPTSTIGDLTIEERRQNVAKLLDPTAELARALGWTVQPGSTAELWMLKHPTSLANYIWINPTTERLWVRIRPNRPEDMDTLQRIASSLQAKFHDDFDPQLDRVWVRQSKTRNEVLNLSVPMSAIDRHGSVSATTQSLQDFIGPIVKAFSL